MIGTLAKAHRAKAAGLGVVCTALAAVAAGSHVVSALRQPLPLVWPLAALQVAFAVVPLGGAFGALGGGAVRARQVRAWSLGLTTTLLGLTATVDHAFYANAAFLTWFVLLAAGGVVAPTITVNQGPAVVLGLGMVSVGLEFMTALAPISRTVGRLPLAAALALYAACAVAFVVLTPRHR